MSVTDEANTTVMCYIYPEDKSNSIRHKLDRFWQLINDFDMIKHHRFCAMSTFINLLDVTMRRIAKRNGLYALIIVLTKIQIASVYQ